MRGAEHSHGNDAAPAAAFLRGGGDMGARMRAADWGQSPLGPPEAWPQSLRSAASICLETKFPIAIYWGPDLALLYNDAWSDIPGEKHPWALGRAAREVWPEIWSDIGPLFERVRAGGEGVWQQDRLLAMHRHGYTEECYFNFTFSPIKGQDGRVEGIFNAVVETTFRVLSERRERALRELVAAIAPVRSETEVHRAAARALEGAADLPFVLLYNKGDAGPAFAAAAGLAALPPGAEALEAAGPFALALEAGGLAPVDLLPPALAAALPGSGWPDPVRQMLISPIAAGGAQAFMAAGISPRRALDGDYRAFIERVAGHIGAALVNARAYEEEQRRSEALAELDRAKTAFFSNISHEFRTPLTLLLGPLEDLLTQAGALPEETRERIAVAHRNGQRLLRLVNTLLDFSRIEAGREQARFAPVDLGVLTADLASTFRSAVERAGLKLSVACEPLPQPAFVDAELWEKIVLNLLSNAFKFTFEGEIAVTLRAGDGAAELCVRDTGVGIAENELPRLFERFHRIEGAKGRSFEGSGIGLALVQDLVKLHGGAIAVESRLGEGSAFTVTIPLGDAHLPRERVQEAVPPAPARSRAQAFAEEALRWLPEPASPSPAPQPQQGRRVLLADDNADMRDYVARILETAGFAVEAVADGEAALAAARRARPDLVLTDAMMPGLDGLGLVRALRADAALRDLPAIVLSARAGEEASTEGLAAGADDYLVKPFSAHDLTARVDSALALARMRREMGAALRESEERLQLATDGAGAGVWDHDLVGGKFVWSARHCDLFGVARDVAPTFELWRARVHPGDLDAALAEFSRARDSREPFRAIYRIVLDDGAERWIEDSGRYFYDAEGAPVRCAGVILDVSARKRGEEMQQLLLDELNHRVKNTLATVQSLAMQTLRSAEDPEHARDRLEGRLLALSGAHEILTQQNWERASLREVLESALGAYRADPGDRFDIDGEDVALPPKHALALTLALHELATNAVKYGALSNESGRVAIAWRLSAANGERRMRLEWRERGGPPVEPPSRRGFGSRLLERGLAYDLGGAVALDYARDGFCCAIEAPI